ncbi:hypothetical protein PGSY75_1140800 [Plasmodium gaboni]|uniref:CID domain-containing protein n=1 Tax=Plasmodium gaboni TaxID=647221 RepID=A0A151LJ95_9APIC|nr:hypothetical protein PGSY75_1140800 [Plasmodium gaboni]KYN99043.1 hypothetical protein PGSY75_1140800 [Plasmodium gaboni]
MKYEKKYWNDKGKKRNEKQLNDDNYRNNRKYQNDSGYNKVNNNNKMQGEKGTYNNTPFLGNMKNKKYNYEGNTIGFDKRNSNHEYIPSFNKKGGMHQKSKNPNLYYQDKYGRENKERSPRYNYNRNKYNKNYPSGDHINNNENYNNEYYNNYMDDGNNNNNYIDDGNNYMDNSNNYNYMDDSNNNNYMNDQGKNIPDIRQEDINIELNKLHRDLHNLLFTSSKNNNIINANENNNLNIGDPMFLHNIMTKNNQDNFDHMEPLTNFNDSQNDFNKNFGDFFNSYDMNAKYKEKNIRGTENYEKDENEVNQYGKNYNYNVNDQTGQNYQYDNDNKNSNHNLNNKGNFIKSNTTTNNSDVLTQLSILRNIPFNNSIDEEEEENDKTSTNEKTAMILNDLKKCLNKNDSNIYTNTDNTLSGISNEGEEYIYENDMMKNQYVDKLHNNHHNNNNNNNNFHMYQEKNDNNLKYQSGMNNYYKNDNKSLEESSISNGSSVEDTNEYKNKKEEEYTYNDMLFPKSKIEESLRVLNTLQVDIERVCCYIKHFIEPPEPLFEVMINVFIDKKVSVNSKMAIFYVYNHLIQELRNNLKNDLIKFNSIADKGLHIFVIPVLRHILEERGYEEMINKFFRCIGIWNDRNVYSKIVCDQLKSLQKNPNKKMDFSMKHPGYQAHSLLSNELSKFLPINFILKMPSTNNEHKKALQNKILTALFNNISKETLKEFQTNDIEEASKLSDKVMRMFGQELVLINSQILELSSLITDNNNHLVKIQNALEKLNE